MEVGKYISLGHGIQIRLGKDDNYTYYYNYRDKQDNNKVKRKKLFSSSKATPENFKKAILQSNNVIAPLEEKEEEEKKIITLNDLADFFFEEKIKKKKSDLKREYSHLKTQEELENFTLYKNQLKNKQREVNRYNKAYRDSSIAKKDITKLTSKEIHDYLHDDLHTVAKKTFYEIYSQAKSIVNYAIKEQQISIVNPFQFVDIKNHKHQRPAYLNENQIQLLLSECLKYKKDTNVFKSVYIALLTACRSGTALNVRVKDFDFENKTLSLYNTKTNKYYNVIINDTAIKYFKNHLKDYDLDDYVIRPNDPRRRKKQPMVAIPKMVYKIMDRLFNQGLDKKNNRDRDKVINYHSLRRSISTNLAVGTENRSSVSIYKIMTLLNHSSVKQTQDYLNLSNISIVEENNQLQDTFLGFIHDEKEIIQKHSSKEEYYEHIKNNEHGFYDEEDLDLAEALKFGLEDWE